MPPTFGTQTSPTVAALAARETGRSRVAYQRSLPCPHAFRTGVLSRTSFDRPPTRARGGERRMEDDDLGGCGWGTEERADALATHHHQIRQSHVFATTIVPRCTTSTASHPTGRISILSRVYSAWNAAIHWRETKTHPGSRNKPNGDERISSKCEAIPCEISPFVLRCQSRNEQRGIRGEVGPRRTWDG